MAEDNPKSTALTGENRFATDLGHNRGVSAWRLRGDADGKTYDI
jgi:hypothetical protein